MYSLINSNKLRQAIFAAFKKKFEMLITFYSLFFFLFFIKHLFLFLTLQEQNLIFDIINIIEDDKIILFIKKKK